MVTPYTGPRVHPPPPPRAPLVPARFLVVVALLALAIYWCWRDADEHYRHYRSPPPVCRVQAHQACTVESLNGPLTVSQGYHGAYEVSTEQPRRYP